MANRHTFPTFPESAQDALFFQVLDSIAQKFGATADTLTPNQVQAFNKSSRLGSLYDVLVALNAAFGQQTVQADGLHGAVKIATATYDVSGGDSGSAAAHGLGVTLPDNSIVIGGWYDVITTFTDGVADAGTIALHIQSAGDLKAAIAVADASNVWDAGLHGLLPGNFALDGNALTAIAMAAARAASNIKLTAAREITATVGGVAMTAGKMVVYVAYVPGL